MGNQTSNHNSKLYGGNNASNNNLTYFYKSTCPYSKKTKEIVREHFEGRNDIKVNPVCVDNNPEQWKQKLSHMSGKPVTTFPQIFFNKQHIGGYTDFADRLNI